MSRGRRQSARAIVAPARPAPPAGVNELLADGVVGLAREILSSPGDLDAVDRPSGGGLVGDLDRHAGDLYELADLVAWSKDPEADRLVAEILERANAHEEQHIERIIAAREHPRSTGAELWRKNNLPGGREATSASYQLLRRSRERLERGRKRVVDPSPLRMWSSPVPGRLRDLAIWRLILPEVRARLIADPRSGLELAKQAAERMSRTETAERTALATLADAQAAGVLLAARAAAGKEVNPLPVLGQLPQDVLAREQLEHEAGDRAERRRARAWKTFWCDPQAPLLMEAPPDLHQTHRNRVVLEPAADAETARARARGLLRDPEAHEGPRYGERAGRRISVPVTEGVLHDLIGAEDDPDLVFMRATGNEGVVRLALRRRARVDGHDVEVRYTLELGSSRRRSVGPLVADLLPEGLPEPTVVVNWPDDSGARAVSRGFRPEDPPPGMNLEEFLGPDVCEHQGASWRLNGTKSAALLSCTRCLRRRIAAVPLHQVRPNHPLWHESDLDEEGYLTQERIRRALFGEPDLPAGTRVADLRETDGLADLSPVAYAAGAAPLAPAGRSGSLAGALGGRRAPGARAASA